MSLFLSYIFLGLSLSAPIGPINAAQLNNGIKNGFLSAWLVGIGAMIADLTFMFIIYFGLVNIIEIPIVKTFLWLFGSFVLIYTGAESILSTKQQITVENRIKDSYSKSFLTGFFMALSNPLNILFWLGIFGSILADSIDRYKEGQILIYSTGIFLGIFIWDFIMAVIASSLRKMGNPRFLTYVSYTAGLILIGFGVYFGSQAYLALF